MNLIAPLPGFLQRMRELCTRYGAVLIFDEVMTGFRVGLQGAQQLYGVQADLVTLGKIIGGGMPLGAFGGRRDIMGKIAPLGPVYQAASAEEPCAPPPTGAPPTSDRTDEASETAANQSESASSAAASAH